MIEAPWAAMEQRLVHRKAADSVLVDAYRKSTGRDVEFGLRRPDASGPFELTGATSDSLLVAEYLRQVTIAYGHLAWDVPVGWAFIMGRMELSVERALPPGALTAYVRPVAPRLTNGALRAVTSDVTFHADGHVFARGRGDLSVVSESIYARLRGEVAVPPSPLADSSALPECLHLAAVPASPDEWRIHFDSACAFFFDHEVDHVPGMLLFSAVRQACMKAAGALVADIRQFDGRYLRFAELDEPLRVRVATTEARLLAGIFTAIIFGANDSPILEARVEVAR